MPNTVVLNSVTLAPTTLETTVTKIGETKRMANGAMRFFYRASKRSWTLSWENAPASIIANAYSAYTVNTSTTFVDEYGTSYTVVSSSDFSVTLDASAIASNGTFYYSASFTIEEV